MARGRKAKAECSKCGTIMGLGEMINETVVRMVCTNCEFTKEILLEKVPDVCRKNVVEAAIPDVDEEVQITTEPTEDAERVEVAL